MLRRCMRNCQTKRWLCRSSVLLLGVLALPQAWGREGVLPSFQEVREAYMHARLADHAGEPWARLDLAGCELKPGSAHADALRQVCACEDMGLMMHDDYGCALHAPACSTPAPPICMACHAAHLPGP